MVEINIQLTKVEGKEMNVRVEGHGKESDPYEVAMGQKIIAAINKFLEPVFLRSNTPRIETIVEVKDSPQEN